MIIYCEVKTIEELQTKQYIRTRTKVLLTILLPIASIIALFVVSILISFVYIRITDKRTNELKNKKLKHIILTKWKDNFNIFNDLSKTNQTLHKIKTIENVFKILIEDVELLEEIKKINFDKFNEEEGEKALKECKDFSKEILDNKDILDFFENNEYIRRDYNINLRLINANIDNEVSKKRDSYIAKEKENLCKSLLIRAFKKHFEVNNDALNESKKEEIKNCFTCISVFSVFFIISTVFLVLFSINKIEIKKTQIIYVNQIDSKKSNLKIINKKIVIFMLLSIFLGILTIIGSVIAIVLLKSKTYYTK